MCGRYSLQTKRVDLAHELRIPVDDVLDLPARWNVAPSSPVPVLRMGEDVAHEGRPIMALHVWGWLPPGMKTPAGGRSLINARRETLATTGFRTAFLQGHRCLVIADGFYEWAPLKPGGPRVPWYIRLKSGAPFTIAGLWARWRAAAHETSDTCTIVTGPPNELVRTLHDRMPVILPAEAREEWLDPRNRDEAKLQSILDVLPADQLETYPVGRRVNSPDNDDASCIAPLSDEERAALEAPAPPRRKARAPRPRPPGPDLFGGT